MSKSCSFDFVCAFSFIRAENSLFQFLFRSSSNVNGTVGVGVVASADGVNASAFVVVRGATEVATPDDESVVEHAALF